MRKLFAHAFDITNKNIILTVPLIVFMWFVSAYAGFTVWTAGTAGAGVKGILAFVTLFFMLSAFISGWLNMVKEAVHPSTPELTPWGRICSGVGGYFLPVAGMLVLFTLFAAACTYAVYYAGVFLFGALRFDPAELLQAMASAQGMKSFVDSLTAEQLVELFNWNLLLLLTSTLFSFLLMLWLPEIFFNTSNPLLALGRSVKKLFDKFAHSIRLFLYLVFLNFTISFVSTFSMLNSFAYAVMMIFYFYFLVYVVVLIFSYYEKEFIKG